MRENDGICAHIFHTRPQHTRHRFQHQRALHLVQRSKLRQLPRNPYYFLSDITPTSSTRTWFLHAWVVNLATVSLASSSDMFLFMYIFPGLHLFSFFSPHAFFSSRVGHLPLLREQLAPPPCSGGGVERGIGTHELCPTPCTMWRKMVHVAAFQRGSR